MSPVHFGIVSLAQLEVTFPHNRQYNIMEMSYWNEVLEWGLEK